MPQISGSEEIRALERRYHFKFDKSLGQNFINDQSVLDDIADACGAGPKDLVLEIGPGMGFLTMALADRAGKVLAVEIDERLIPILDRNLALYNNVEIINQDILKTDIPALIEEKGRLKDGSRPENIRIVGNLPYYITTPILTGLLEAGLDAESITVMVQREVADRIMARPATRPYCVLTLELAYYGTPEVVRDVPAELFVPRPKVDSAVVKLSLVKGGTVLVKDRDLLFKVIKAGFGQRRKTLSNALALGGFGKEETARALEKAGIDGQRRAETLSLKEFADITGALAPDA
ncbi:MAG: 16S rRNA (adenine(1518)-N(6)/adenine(1519)-N(6))-dimethyltransferase RsmA [Firmicutes bacterium]|nr:16S rRNA (adenine(1518)-N(6)/adenine(1519)-N(6))-dimethyltransferase RsmA [Bacillota bacterium]